MWTVLRKELREGWLFLLINVLVLMGMPPLGRLCLPRQWDADVTAIFYAVMFGVFLPLYLVILAAGLVQDENAFLIRGLPVKPWKVAGGKLLYLALNFMVLEILCTPFFVGQLALPDWIASDLPYIYLWMGATAVAALTSFAFASFLPRKSYAIFSALAATILGMGSLMYLTAAYFPAVMADWPIHILLAGIFILLLAGGFILYHDFIRQARRGWVRAAAVALLLPVVAGVLWLRAPLWLKQIVVGNPDQLMPAGDGLFITGRMGPRKEYYVFDAKSGDLRSFPFIGNTEIITGADPGRNTVYAATTKPIPRGEQWFRKYSAIDLTSGKTRELGLLSVQNVVIEGEIAHWGHSDSSRTFGFKDLVRGTTFDFKGSGCSHTIWGSEGVLYDSVEPEGSVWKFVDFAATQTREAFRGEYYPWPWSVGGGYYLYAGVRDASTGIPYDRELFRWDPATRTLRKLGLGRPLLGQDNLAVLIRGNKNGPKTLVLLRDDKEVSTLPIDSLGAFPVGFYQYNSIMQLRSPWKIVLLPDRDGAVRSLGVLTIEGDRLNLKTVPLPPLADVAPIPGSGDLLLFVRQKTDEPEWNNSLCRVYRMDPVTGKKKRLV